MRFVDSKMRCRSFSIRYLFGFTGFNRKTVLFGIDSKRRVRSALGRFGFFGRFRRFDITRHAGRNSFVLLGLKGILLLVLAPEYKSPYERFRLKLAAMNPFVSFKVII
jgi:hypothetical protein